MLVLNCFSGALGSHELNRQPLEKQNAKTSVQASPSVSPSPCAASSSFARSSTQEVCWRSILPTVESPRRIKIFLAGTPVSDSSAFLTSRTEIEPPLPPLRGTRKVEGIAPPGTNCTRTFSRRGEKEEDEDEEDEEDKEDEEDEEDDGE